MGHAALSMREACPCRCPCPGRSAWNRRSPLPRRRRSRDDSGRASVLPEAVGPDDGAMDGLRQSRRQHGTISIARRDTTCGPPRCVTGTMRPAKTPRPHPRAPARERSGSSGSCRPRWTRRAWTRPRPARAPWRPSSAWFASNALRLHEIHEPVEALLDDLAGRVVVHLRSRGPLALGVDEREHLADSRPPPRGDTCPSKSSSVSPGNPDDDVRGQRDVGTGVARSFSIRPR